MQYRIIIIRTIITGGQSNITKGRIAPRNNRSIVYRLRTFHSNDSHGPTPCAVEKHTIFRDHCERALPLSLVEAWRRIRRRMHCSSRALSCCLKRKNYGFKSLISRKCKRRSPELRLYIAQDKGFPSFFFVRMYLTPTHSFFYQSRVIFNIKLNDCIWIVLQYVSFRTVHIAPRTVKFLELSILYGTAR